MLRSLGYCCLPRRVPFATGSGGLGIGGVLQWPHLNPLANLHGSQQQFKGEKELSLTCPENAVET